MRTVRWTLLCVCSALLCVSVAHGQNNAWGTPAWAAPQGIPWLTDLQQARQVAEQQQRLMLLHFWADDCPPCRQLEAGAFRDPGLIRAITANYIPVKVHVDQRPDLAQHFRVNRWPTDIVLTSGGKEVTRYVAPQDPIRYGGMLDQFAAQHRVRPDMGAIASAATGGPAMGGPAPGGPAPSAPLPAWSGYGPPASGPTNVPSAPAFDPLRQPYPAAPSLPLPNYANNYGPASDANFPALNPPNNPLGPAPHTSASPSLPTASPSLPAMPSSPAAVENQFFPRSPAPSGPPALPGNNDWSNRGPAPGTPGTAPATGNPADWNAPPNSAPAPQHVTNTHAETAKSAPVALEGYCPVTLVTAKGWKKGDSRFGVQHRGLTFLFASQLEQQEFLRSPDKYSPMLAGYDPVRFAEQRQLIVGQRQHGLFFDDRIYLFSDESSLQQFAQKPLQYHNLAQDAMRQASSGR